MCYLLSHGSRYIYTGFDVQSCLSRDLSIKVIQLLHFIVCKPLVSGQYRSLTKKLGGGASGPTMVYALQKCMVSKR